jgi:hypothetical protein
MSYDYSGASLNTGQNTNAVSSIEQLAIVTSVITNLSDIPDDTINILDKFDGLLEDADYITKNGNLYGAVKFKYISHRESDPEHLPLAFPLDKSIQRIPVEHETIRIHNISGNLYYSLLSYNNSPNFDTIPSLLFNTIKVTPAGGLKANNEKINDVAKSGIANDSNSTESTTTNTKKDFHGKYFKRDLRVHRLSLREGDTTIQGRFGNSLRLSGYLHDNKDDGVYFPAILIRNGESATNKSKKVYDVVDEDINSDGTSIHITSGDYISTYQPVVNYDDGYNFPSEAKGDQIVVNSDRVAISSKADSIFLYGNKNISLLANNLLTIDSTGIDITSRNTIHISAKDNNDMVFSVDNGKILLGSGKVEQQMLLGNKMINLIAQLLDAITQMQIATPSGPSAPGPINRAAFTDIGNKLKDCLSKTNYLV